MPHLGLRYALAIGSRTINAEGRIVFAPQNQSRRLMLA